MATGIQDFQVYIDEDPQLTVTVTVTGDKYGAVVNVSGWTVTAVIHARAGDGVPLQTYTPAIPTGSDGKVVWTIPNADLAALGVGDFAYYLARTDASSGLCILKGTLSILPV